MSETVTATRGVASDVDQIGTYMPVPGMGVLPVNAFVLHAEEPVLIDAGVVSLRAATMQVLREIVDPGALRWIYLTHTDPDHIGCLAPLLEEAPNARVVTTFLGMGKLGLAAPIPPERVLLLNPGQSLDVGDRCLVAGRPPTYDAPETTWVRDARTGVLFSSDCFGAVLERPFESADQVPAAQLRDGLVAWTGIDAPWFANQDPASVAGALGQALPDAPEVILGAHLPPARRMSDQLVAYLEQARHAPPHQPPDQAALERMFDAA